MAETFNNNQNTFNNTQGSNNNEAKENQGANQNTGQANTNATQSSNSQPATNQNNSASQTVDYSKVALDDRVSTHDVDNHTKDLYITEKDGTKLYVQLQAPKLAQLQDIQDSQYGATFDTQGNQIMRNTTKTYYEALFPLFHNLQADEKPAGQFGWDFGEDHLEAFNWLISQASSFLGDTFNPDK